MTAPSRQELDIVTRAASAAAEFQQALQDLAAFNATLSNNPFSATVAQADFSATDANGNPVAGKLQGFNTATLTTFLSQAAALNTQLQAGGSLATLAQAFGAMAAWK